MEPFGKTGNGDEVYRIALSGGGLTGRILTWGGVLQDLRLDGSGHPLVLGFPDFASYPAYSPSFGANVGRVANRIAGARARIAGRQYIFDRNFLGKHTLHGGADGAGRRLWHIEDHGADFAVLSIRLPDGHMGFPGNLDVSLHYSLPGNGVLEIAFTAATDAPTLCNFAHHSYFNLDGGHNALDHELQIAADAYLPVDGELIPTGEIAPVDGTPFDFRRMRPIAWPDGAISYDNNFCLSRSRQPMREVARLRGPRHGITMTVETTEPGLQLFDGAATGISAVPGLSGFPYAQHAGIALEAQIWPDAPNHPEFPSAELRPGETVTQITRFVFDAP